MTLVPERKTCPKCHRKYSWNPDVGKFFCPYCLGMGTPLTNLADRVFNKKKRSDSEK